MDSSNGSRNQGDHNVPWMRQPAVSSLDVGFSSAPMCPTSPTSELHAKLPSTINWPNFSSNESSSILDHTPKGDVAENELWRFHRSKGLEDNFRRRNTTETSPPLSAVSAPIPSFNSSLNPTHSINKITQAPNRVCEVESPQRPISGSKTTDEEAISWQKYSAAEWKEREPEIEYFYKELGYPLPVVEEEMRARGFHPSTAMYKRKFRKWKWKTYQTSNDGLGIRRRSKNHESVRKRAIRRSTSSPCTLQPHEIYSDKSRGSSIVRLRYSIGSSSSSKIPTPMSKDAIELLFTGMLSNIRDFYVSEIKLSKFQINSKRTAEEKNQRGLFFETSRMLYSYNLIDNAVYTALALTSNQGPFRSFEKTIKNGEGTDCEFFTLPLVWRTYLCTVQEQQLGLGAFFLSHAIMCARSELPEHHFLVQALALFQRQQVVNTENLEEITFRAYRCCLSNVEELSGSSNVNFLSLWADFTVQSGPSSSYGAKMVFERLQQELQRYDDTNIEYDLYALQILGIAQHVLDCTPSTTEDVENMVLELARMVQNRVREPSGQLKIELLNGWKDLKLALAKFCHFRGDDRAAILHLESSLRYGVVTVKDISTLRQLKERYEDIGEFEEARNVRKWRRREKKFLQKKLASEPSSAADLEHLTQVSVIGSDNCQGGVSSDYMVVEGWEDYNVVFPEKGSVWELASVELEVRA